MKYITEIARSVDSSMNDIRHISRSKINELIQDEHESTSQKKINN